MTHVTLHFICRCDTGFCQCRQAPGINVHSGTSSEKLRTPEKKHTFLYRKAT